MRREGYIIEEIVAYPNMAQSFDQVLRGTSRKRSRQGRWLLAHREEVIAELSAQIADGSYFIAGGYRERTIIEGGKERHIQVLTMKDRIAVHAVMSVVDEHLKRLLYAPHPRASKGEVCTTSRHISSETFGITRRNPGSATNSTSQSSMRA